MTFRKLILFSLIFASLCACEQNKSNSSDVEPVKLEDIPGTNLHRVILTGLAAKRIDLQTVKVVSDAAGSVIPYSSMIYDAKGQAWVYSVIGKLTYVRAPIHVQSIISDKVILKDGPPVGTEIVSIGVSELYGSEYLGNIEE